MSERHYTLLPSRGVLSVSGPDARTFLQGMITNDVTRLSETSALWAALLTPQGKYLHDFFLAQPDPAHPHSMWLDCEAARLDDLRARLGRYRLRARVDLLDASPCHAVAVAWGDDALDALGLKPTPGLAAPFAKGVAYTDPRHAGIGARLILPAPSAAAALDAAGFEASEPAAYDRLRLALGLPDGSRDLEADKTILLEAGFDELHGVDWDKGCYMGQELTARTWYRGLVKRRLVPVSIEGPPPEPGSEVTRDGKRLGEMRSSVEGHGLALLRLEALEEGAPLAADDALLFPRKPEWMKIRAARAR